MDMKIVMNQYYITKHPNPDFANFMAISLVLRGCSDVLTHIFEVALLALTIA